MESLAKEYHCRTEAIKNVLILNNIKIKTKGRSVNRTLNESFFEHIDTEEKAYFLGFLFADGSVVKDNENRRSPMISLQLKLEDQEMVEKFKKTIKGEGKIYYDKRLHKETASFRFRSQIMADDLSKYGIVPNKTYLTEHLPEIPQELDRHFLRGLLDGDGSIYQLSHSNRYAIDLCSYHATVCNDFRERCDKFLTCSNNATVTRYGTAYHVRFVDKQSVMQLATALYKDGHIYLDRKYELARKIFEIK